MPRKHELDSKDKTKVDSTHHTQGKSKVPTKTNIVRVMWNDNLLGVCEHFAGEADAERAQVEEFSP